MSQFLKKNYISRNYKLYNEILLTSFTTSHLFYRHVSSILKKIFSCCQLRQVNLINLNQNNLPKDITY